MKNDYVVSGVYKITFKLTGHIYIGSSVNIINRWYALSCNLSSNSKLFRGIVNRFGYTVLDFSIIELQPPDKLHERELFWINTLHTTDPTIGLNRKRFCEQRYTSSTAKISNGAIARFGDLIRLEVARLTAPN